MTTEKQLSIIIPSFKDPRILETIASVRLFDDLDATKIVVIDGGSPRDLVNAIAESLTSADILVSERDDGIFDGLNKGLDRVDTRYIGWIGSDDLYTGQVKASEVISALQSSDLFIASLAFFRGETITRVTHSWPSAHGLGYHGLHNPHYATFGTSELLGADRFPLNDPLSDQNYFFAIFDRKPRVSWSSKIAVLAGEGGNSTATKRQTLRLNRLMFRAYRQRHNPMLATLDVMTKVGYKLTMRLVYRLRRLDWPRRYPDLHRAIQNARRTANPARIHD